MKKTILLVALLAVITALAYIGCGDSGVQNKNPEITDLLSFFTGSDTRYTLTVNVTPTNGGTVSRNPSGTSYKAGSKVAVTATPSNGYRFTGWSGASNDTAVTVTITMDDNQTLTANFVSTSANTATYTLSVNVTPANSGNILREPNKVRYNAGETVTVTADPMDGYTFTGWTGNVNKTDNSVTITMNGNMTLNANFQQNTYSLSVNANPTQGGTVSRNPQKSAYTYGEEVTVTATPATGYAFDGYTGAVTSTSAGVTVIMNDNKTLTAKFIQQTAPSYTLSTVANPAVATISRRPDNASYQTGETVTVTAPTTEGYTFTGWSGASTSTASSVTITMDGNKSLTANYKSMDYILTVDVIPAVGGTVSRNPNNNTYTYNQIVTVDATPAVGYKFTGWSGAAAAGASTYSTYATVTMNSNKSLTATFEQFVFSLSTYAFPSGTGTVSISPNKNLYTYNEQVTVTATPASGYTFTGWSDAALGMTNPVTIVMIEGRSLTANFQQTLYTLTTNVSPTGSGSVSRSPNQTSYTPGSTVTLTATPMSGSSYVFKGWSGASSSTNATITITMDGDKSLTAGFGLPDAKRFNVYFNGNGATTDGANPPQAATADSGSSISLPGQQTLVKTGYNFGGWNTNSFGTGTFYSAGASYTVNGNSTLYAKWIPIYTVTFNGNGTTSGVPQAVSVDSGTAISIPGQGSMTRNGYTFGWWNTTSTGTGIRYDVGGSYTVNGNSTLYAKWIPIYTLTFNGNGTTVGVPDAVSVDSGTVITLPSQGSMTRSGYSFGKWNTTNTGSGTNYTAGTSYTVTGNTTLYVKWIPIYKVTFNGNGTTANVPDAINADSGSSITLPGQGSMTRSNYNFGGWNTNTGGTGTNYNAGISYTVTGNITLYAKWTVYPKYTITYNGNGSTSGSVTATSADSSSVITLPSQGTLVKTGYNFSGWNTNNTGTGINYNEGTSYNVKGDVTLYAKWTIKTYSVTYNGNGNTSGSVTATAADSGSVITLSGQETLVKTGYNFNGWNTNSNGTGTNYSAGTSYTVKGDITLYAKWTIKTYTVTYNGNGNTSGSVTATAADSGSVITLPSNGTMVKIGHNFSGWNTNSDGTGTNYSAGAPYSVKDDVTLYATWTIKMYTVTYNGNGNTSGSVAAVQVDSNSTITLPNNETMVKTGYNFSGWNTNSGGTGINYSAGTSYSVKGDVTLYAKWMWPIVSGTLTDTRDRKTYKTTKTPDGKTWMAENLNYQPQQGNSWCYKDSTSYCGKYGRLYDWNTAMAGSPNSDASTSNVRGVCPPGWHLPSRTEWQTLVSAVGSPTGKKLKSKNGWNDYKGQSGNGTDDFGFSALPGGYRHNTSIGDFLSAGYNGYWWTATENEDDRAYVRSMFYYDEYVGVDESFGSKEFGFSVRCVQDE